MKLYCINGHWWLGFERGTMLYLVCYKGESGDRIRV